MEGKYILAGLTGVLEGLTKGLEARKANELQERKVANEEANLALQTKIANSKENWYRELSENKDVMSAIAGKKLGIQQQEVNIKQENLTSDTLRDLLGKKSQASTELRRIKQDRNKLATELQNPIYTKEKYASKKAEKQSQLDDYDAQISDNQQTYDLIDQQLSRFQKPTKKATPAPQAVMPKIEKPTGQAYSAASAAISKAQTMDELKAIADEADPQITDQRERDQMGKAISAQIQLIQSQMSKAPTGFKRGEGR